MNEHTILEGLNIRQNANLFSKLFCLYLDPLIFRAFRQPLTIDDLIGISENHKSSYLCDQLQREWNKELMKSKPSLNRALYRLHRIRIFLLSILLLSKQIIQISLPIQMSYLLTNIELGDSLLLWSIGISTSVYIISILNTLYGYETRILGMTIQIAFTSMIYRKSLKLPSSTLSYKTGYIINLMSNDVNRFDIISYYLCYLWTGPIIAIFTLVLLLYYVGIASLSGFLFLICTIALNYYGSKYFKTFRHKIAKQTDIRIGLMNEIITAMKVLKMYCWENFFSNIINETRRKEVEELMKSSFTKAVLLAPFFSAPKFMICITMLVFVQFNNHVFSINQITIVIGLYNTIKLDVNLFVPLATQCSSECLISIERIKNFLLEVEYVGLKSVGTDNKEIIPKNNNTNMISARKMTAQFTDTETPVLDNLTFNIKKGDFVAIIGHVGSGKTSLLKSLLGEIQVTGFLNIEEDCKIAYVPQEPWIFSSSIRQNIIFGKSYDSIKFKKLMNSVSLKQDINTMANGELTLVGEKGISLSGGQKARLGLARAAYAHADLILMDDPLSAVDNVVGRHLFNQCMRTHMGGITRILVTHQIQYLKDVDYIIVIDKGRIKVQGSYDELINQDIDIIDYIDETDTKDDTDDINVEIQKKKLDIQNDDTVDDSQKEVTLDFNEKYKENILEGSIGWRVYLEYIIKGAGIGIILLSILLNIGMQVSIFCSDYLVTRWSKQEMKHQYIIYFSLVCGVCIFAMLNALVLFYIALCASKNLHTKMFTSIMRVPMKFFESNPIGRILNRFSTDTGQIDEIIPLNLYDMITNIFTICLILISSTLVSLWMIFGILGLILVVMLIGYYYMRTSRSVKRLEKSTRSLVLSHASASIVGIESIRTFRKEQILIKEFDDHLDLHSRAWELYISSKQWLSIRVDITCCIFISVVFLLRSQSEPNFSTTVTIIPLIYIVSLIGLCQWTVSQMAELETNMTSVERVLEYSNLTSEKYLKGEIDPNWPSKGELLVKNACLKYDENSNNVIDNINFEISHGEKIGIVGRTGAGKSSLVTMLFRLVEPTGIIKIDGIDICSLGLHDLRSKISIIPQDPILFIGTLRDNIDPFKTHNDFKIWRVLEMVQMKTLLADKSFSLDSDIKEGGSNFSVGEKQLLCLARAILKENKILIMDEATANIDMKTDQIIQSIIRELFIDCTVLTIAHRLHSVLDNDRIMVMQKGKIVEFDRPDKLMDIEDGYFKELVNNLK